MSITEIWADTGTVVQRDPTPEEIAQREADRRQAGAAAIEMQQEQERRDAARASALNKLRKLGLTDEEVSALTGVAQ